MGKRKNIREHIIDFVNENAGWRMSNVERGTASHADKQLLDEALAFRSIAIFGTGMEDSELKRLWQESNLEYSL